MRIRRAGRISCQAGSFPQDRDGLLPPFQPTGFCKTTSAAEDVIVRPEIAGYAFRVKLRPLLVPVLSFAAGVAAFVCYWLGVDGPEGGPFKGDQAQAALRDGKAAGKQDHPPLAGAPSSIPTRGESFAFAGLQDRPTLDDIFNAAGIERPLRIGIFLKTASSDEIAALVTRAKKEWTYDTSLTDQIWLRWVEIDREAAFKADASGTAVWWAWAKLDPQAALAGAAANPRHLEEVIRSIGQGDQEAAIRLLSEHPAADTPLVWEGILNGISKTDRGAAAALALEKNLKLDEYVGKWVAWEPEAALTWARGLEDPVQRRRVMDLAVQELITADPRAAMAELERLPAGRSRTERTAEAIAALSRTDPAAARAAAGALTNPADRQRALSDLTETLAARDQKTALAILQDLTWSQETTWSYQLANGHSSSGISSGPDHQSIRQLMQTAPEATANALISLPPDRNVPVGQAVRQWAAQQPEAASRWIQAMPTGLAKDRAITGLTQWLTQESPEPDYEAAMAWSGATSTPELQFQSAESIISVWQNQDWKAARAAVDRLSITPEQREQLLHNFGNSPPDP